MRRRDDNNHALADAAATFVVIACLTAVMFVLRTVTVVTIRTYMKYGRRPLPLALLALWALSLVGALTVGQMPGDRNIAIIMPVSATTLFVVFSALLEVIYDHLALKAQPDDDMLGKLPDWWT